MPSDDETQPIIQNDAIEEIQEEHDIRNQRTNGIVNVPPEASPIERNEDPEPEIVLTGCGASALCDPRRMPHRFIALFLMCLLGFGSTFCYDTPGKHLIPNFYCRILKSLNFRCLAG